MKNNLQNKTLLALKPNLMKDPSIEGNASFRKELKALILKYGKKDHTPLESTLNVHKNSNKTTLVKQKVVVRERKESTKPKSLAKGIFNEEFFKEGSRFCKAYVVVLSSINNKWTDKDLMVFIRAIFIFYNHCVKHHGISAGTSRYKVVSSYLLALCEGRNPDNPGWVATEPVLKVPSSLMGLYPLVENILGKGDKLRDLSNYQIIASLLAIPRMSDAIPELNLSSVVLPLNVINIDDYKKLLTSFRSFLFGKIKLKLPSPRPELFVQPSFRMTSGPNGGPTLSKSAEEAKSLLEDKILGSAFKDLCTLTGNTGLLKYLEEIQGLNLDTSGIYLSKLVLVPDSMNKHRLVAMVDYWTNLILDPIEDLVKKVLIQNFPSDYMSNHSIGAERVRERSDKPLWSIDLKDWTNRFPAALQQQMLARIINPATADAWYRLICTRDFWVPQENRYVKYAVGQPMGSKLSFMLASITHHAFIHYCYFRINGNTKDVHNHYAIVGDDLVIFDEDLYKEVSLQNKNIGVEISTIKSKIPLPGMYFAEFCSRTFINKTDVSRISPNVINLASKGWDDVPLLLSVLMDRGIKVDMDRLPTLPILSKKDKQGVPYLQHLKNALTSEVFGLKGLSEIGKDIPGPNIWTDLNVTTEDIAALAINYATARAIRVLEDAIEYALGEKRKLSREYYKLGTTESYAGNKVFLTKRFAFGDWKYQVDSKSDELIKGEPIMGPSLIYQLASKPDLSPKGWNYQVPHPSSIAIVCQIKSMFDFLLNVVPDYSGGLTSTDQIYKDFIYKVGTNVAQILPKEASDLIVRGKGISQFYKHQTFFSRKLLKAFQESKMKGSNTIIFKDVGVEFNLPDKSKGPVQNLFNKDLKDIKPTNKFSNDIKTLFSLVFSEMTEWGSME